MYFLKKEILVNKKVPKLKKGDTISIVIKCSMHENFLYYNMAVSPLAPKMRRNLEIILKIVIQNFELLAVIFLEICVTRNLY